jgi:hypothetical protein
MDRPLTRRIPAAQSGITRPSPPRLVAAEPGTPAHADMHGFDKSQRILDVE